MAARIAAALLAFCSACAWSSSGIVRFDADGKAQLFTTADPGAGSDVRVQYVDRRGRARCCLALRIEAGRPAPVENPTDVVSGTAVRSYGLRLSATADVESPSLGAAWIDPAPAVRQLSGQELAGGDPQRRRRLLHCYSSEGFHVLETDETSGAVEAHIYLSLDYGVKPTCTRRMVRLMQR